MPSARRVHFLRKLTYSLHLLSGRRPYHLLRLRYEADCLTVQHTKHSLKHPQSQNPKSKPPLARERFSPSTLTCRSRTSASRPVTPALRTLFSAARTRSDACVPRPPVLQGAEFAQVVELVGHDDTLQILQALVP